MDETEAAARRIEEIQATRARPPEPLRTLQVNGWTQVKPLVLQDGRLVVPTNRFDVLFLNPQAQVTATFVADGAVLDEPVLLPDGAERKPLDSKPPRTFPGVSRLSEMETSYFYRTEKERCM